MVVITARKVKLCEKHIYLSDGLDKASQSFLLFRFLRLFYKEMLDGGYVILSYSWWDRGEIDFHYPDTRKGPSHIISADTFYVGKRRARDASVRYLLRKGHNANRLVSN